jgi:hypothetical protein
MRRVGHCPLEQWKTSCKVRTTYCTGNFHHSMHCLSRGCRRLRSPAPGLARCGRVGVWCRAFLWGAGPYGPGYGITSFSVKGADGISTQTGRAEVMKRWLLSALRRQLVSPRRPSNLRRGGAPQDSAERRHTGVFSRLLRQRFATATRRLAGAGRAHDLDPVKIGKSNSILLVKSLGGNPAWPTVRRIHREPGHNRRTIAQREGSWLRLLLTSRQTR